LLELGIGRTVFGLVSLELPLDFKPMQAPAIMSTATETIATLAMSLVLLFESPSIFFNPVKETERGMLPRVLRIHYLSIDY
jgi:hypothetical protein